MHCNKSGKIVVTSLASALSAVFLSAPLLAATFTVNNTADAVDAAPGNGVRHGEIIKA